MILNVKSKLSVSKREAMCVGAVCPYWWHVSNHELFFKILKLLLQLRVFCLQLLNLHKHKSSSVIFRGRTQLQRDVWYWTIMANLTAEYCRNSRR